MLKIDPMRILLALSLAACVARQATPPASEPISVPAQPDPPAPTAEPEQPSLSTMSEEEAAIVASVDEKKIDLPVAWTSGPAAKPVPFGPAMNTATVSRKNFDAVLASLRERTDAGLPQASAFGRAASYVDYTSRLYATAYYASDATPTGKVDALRAAAEMELQWSRKLDELGLQKMPDAWRTDPSIALTFEDMTTGPVKRWRKEGLALVELCVATAKDAKLDTASARTCLAIRRSISTKVLAAEAKDAKDAGPANAPSKSGCACDPGDPLCSATMNGWCAKTR